MLKSVGSTGAASVDGGHAADATGQSVQSPELGATNIGYGQELPTPKSVTEDVGFGGLPPAVTRALRGSGSGSRDNHNTPLGVKVDNSHFDSHDSVEDVEGRAPALLARADAYLLISATMEKLTDWVKDAHNTLPVAKAVSAADKL